MDYLLSGANLSEDGKYRYQLWRVWKPLKPGMVWILLNPSTADDKQDDPTIRRCVSFADQWGYGAIEVVNLLGLRVTRPAHLVEDADPEGPYNHTYLTQAIRDHDHIVVAWGSSGDFATRYFASNLVQTWAGEGRKTLWCLGCTKQGDPRHPLYVKGSTPLEEWHGRS